MSLLKEFKEFAMKGNVVDMAVGVVIGAAFGKIVSSLVGDVVMPLLGKIVELVKSARVRKKLLSAADFAAFAAIMTDQERAAFAAHASVGPAVPGGALFAFWQAAYHLFGQWHGAGGAQKLTDALVHRLRASGGELRCSAPVARIGSIALPYGARSKPSWMINGLRSSRSWFWPSPDWTTSAVPWARKRILASMSLRSGSGTRSMTTSGCAMVGARREAANSIDYRCRPKRSLERGPF